MDLSDRILVLCEGRIVGDFLNGTVTRTELGLLMGVGVWMSTLPLPTEREILPLETDHRRAADVLSSLLAVAIALLAGSIVLALSGANPIPAYEALFAGAFGGQRELAETLVMATPLILGGTAFAVASRAGLFNIGIEGQMVVGGLCAGLAAAWDPGLPIFVHLPLAVLAGMIAGGIWGFIPGFLKAQPERMR